MTEIWRPVAGHAGYEISSDGRVRSVDRVITSMRKGGPVQARLNGRVLAVSTANSGYLIAMIGRARPYIHSLVLEAFVGPRPPGHQAAHGNGDRRDNRVGNLRWATRAENEADKANHGTRLTGARTSNGRKTPLRRNQHYAPPRQALLPNL
jgi:HNH endonuclease/NUMOD4 motif